MEWFRWWHGTLTDPKFQWVARKSGQKFTSVIALWVALLERASNVTQCDASDASQKRGDVTGFDCDDHDVLFGLDDGSCAAIYSAFVAKGMIEDDLITNWEKRQPKREDSSRERTRAYRDRIAKQSSVTDGDAVVTHGDDKSREDKKREEKSSKETKTRAPRFDAQAHLVSLGVDPQVATDWLKVRKAKDSPATETAFDGVATQAEKAGISMADAVKVACENNWAGFKAEWIDKGSGRGGGGGSVLPMNRQEALERQNRRIAMEFAEGLKHAT